MYPFTSRLFSFPGVRPRLALYALSAVLLVALVACSGGQPTAKPTNSYQAAVPVQADTALNCTPCPPAPYIHVATADNTRGDWTYLNAPWLNDNPAALIMVTPVEIVDSTIYQPVRPQHVVGVWYDNTVKLWGIFNEDQAAMQVNSTFDVDPIAKVGTNDLLQTATTTNRGGNWTEIDSPLTNGYPGLGLVVTPNYNPGGVGTSHDSHPLGVIYSAGHWLIYHEDQTSIPVGTTYNVHVVQRPYNVLQEEANTGSSEILAPVPFDPTGDLFFTMNISINVGMVNPLGLTYLLRHCIPAFGGPDCSTAVWWIESSQIIPEGTLYNYIWN